MKLSSEICKSPPISSESPRALRTECPHAPRIHTQVEQGSHPRKVAPLTQGRPAKRQGASRLSTFHEGTVGSYPRHRRREHPFHLQLVAPIEALHESHRQRNG